MIAKLHWFPYFSQVFFDMIDRIDRIKDNVRLARAIIRREHIALCGYHGWHDWSIAKTPQNAGVPQRDIGATKGAFSDH